MKHEKSCGAVIFRLHENREQALLIRHKNSSVWSFPKGHVEQGENELQTALREIAEETGVTDLTLDRGFRHTLEYHTKANVIKQVIFFVGQVRRDTALPRNSDEIVQEARWADTDRVPYMLAFDNHRILFRDALSYWHQHRISSGQ